MPPRSYGPDDDKVAISCERGTSNDWQSPEECMMARLPK